MPKGVSRLKPENIVGVNTLNYKVEIRPNVFFSVLFVDKEKMPLEKIKCFNGDLIDILNKITFLFKSGIDINIGVKLDFEIDVYEIVDIYMNFKDNKVDIQYSLY